MRHRRDDGYNANILNMWWRIFIPTWRLFDTVGAYPELLVKNDGGWTPALRRPHPHWYSLFFYPQAGHFHAENNLLERLAIEIAEGANPEQLVSLALVRDLAAGREFKLRIGEQDILHYRGTV